MRIKRNTHIANNDLIQIKRKAKIYKTIIKQVIYFIMFILTVLGLYYYKEPIADFTIEIQKSYAVLYHKVINLTNKIGDISNQEIDSVEIKGLKYLDKQTIITAMYTIGENDNLKIKSSLHDIHAQILEIPIVESALIRRIVWQKKIFIQIKEKDIIAVVKTKNNENKITLLDYNGQVFNYELSNKFDNLPIIEDSEYPEKIIPIFKYLKEKGIDHHIYGFAMISDRRWNIRFKNNLIVKLPVKEWKNAIDIMLHIDKKVNLFAKDNTMVYMDLRIPDKIFLK